MTGIVEAIVLAGGLGTRLRSVVNSRPKSLAPIAGRPFLDWLLDDLQRHGVKRAVLATGYGSEAIEDKYAAGYDGLGIVISREEEPLGTGGAIRLACTRAQTQRVLVVNGDTFAAWSPDPLLATSTAEGVPITIGLKHVVNPDRYGTVCLVGGRVIAFHEKRVLPEGLVNAGLYLIKPAEMPWPDKQRFSFEYDVLEPACRLQLLAGVVLNGPFIDIGIPEAFAEAQTVIPAWAGSPAGRAKSCR